MLRNYLVVAVRNLLRQGRYSLINIVGLAIGIACCTLISLYVDHELRHDAFHEKGDRIYRLVLEDTHTGDPGGTLFPAELADPVALGVPGIRTAATFIRSHGRVRHGLEVLDEVVALVSFNFLDVFTFPLLHGDPATALQGREGVVISMSAARRLLGVAPGSEEEALGQAVDVNGSELAITGVMADVPPASSLRFDYLLSVRFRGSYFVSSNQIGNTTIYAELESEADPTEVEKSLSGLIPDNLGSQIRSSLAGDFTEERLSEFRLRLQPLRAVHLDRSVESRYTELGNGAYAYILAGMGLLVLLVACINFTTLSVGSSARRSQEVGIRKAAGARRGQLMVQFWGETAVLCLLACALGIGLAELALPVFGELTQKPLSLGQMDGWRGPAFAAAALAMAALLAGAYPAAVLSGLRPVAALKGRRKTSSRQLLLRALLMLQYGLAVGLLVCTVVMVQQWDFLRSKELGFDRESVVVVAAPGEEAATRFRDEALKVSGVISTSASDRSFTSGDYTASMYGEDGSHVSSLRIIRVDASYLGTLGLELKAGRTFDATRASDVEHAVLVNERLVAVQGWDEPVGKVLSIGSLSDAPDPTVVGVVADFHIDNLRREIQPLMLTMDPAYHGLYHVFVRLGQGAGPAALGRLREVWQESAPGEPFEWSYLDENLKGQYRAEERWTRILGWSAGLVVLISCLGLLGQASLSVARRTREIGIRKVLGASAASVLKLFTVESALLLAAASALGWPASFWVMNRWLDGFAYRIVPGPGAYLVASGAVLMLALAVVASQVASSALRSPVQTLRYE